MVAPAHQARGTLEDADPLVERQPPVAILEQAVRRGKRSFDRRFVCERDPSQLAPVEGGGD
jgi:hypothetical protein